MSQETYEKRLNTINIVVSAIIVLIPTIDWILAGKNEVYVILAYAENLPLVLSCVILVLGFKRVFRIVASPTDHIVNRQIIVLHIIAYFFIVTANIAVNFFYYSWKSYAIATYCLLAVNLICNLILAQIVNTICTKYIQLHLDPDKKRISIHLVEDDVLSTTQSKHSSSRKSIQN